MSEMKNVEDCEKAGCWALRKLKWGEDGKTYTGSVFIRKEESQNDAL